MLDFDMVGRQCSIYHAHGIEEVPLEAREPAGVRRLPTIADEVPIGSIIKREVICARETLDVCGVTTLMMKYRIGCVPIVDDRRRPVGVVTKHDLVEHLEVAMRQARAGAPLPADLAPTTAGHLMLPLALAIDQCATIAHAAAMMSHEDIHHVLVVDHEGLLVGVVSSRDIVDWLVGNDDIAFGRS